MFKPKQYWTKERQSFFLMKLSELLQEGFVISQALVFMQLMMPNERLGILYLETLLQQGKPIYEGLGKLGYHQDTISQIALSYHTGSHIRVLYQCGEFIDKRDKQDKKMKQLLIYPMVLVGFILTLLLGMRQFFLPQMKRLSGEDMSVLTRIVLGILEDFPVYVGVSVAVLDVIGVVLRLVYRRKSALAKLLFLHKIPIVSRWIEWYYTAYFCREMGRFYQHGVPLHDMLALMQQGHTAPVLQEFSQLVQQYAAQGYVLQHVIEKMSFLKKEMAYLITHGERISQLSVKLHFYADDCFLQLEKDVMRKMQWVQPIIFCVIGIIVLLIYMALLIPMLSLTDQMF